MVTIYEPTGKAKEYCDLALNLYRGCSNGCTYCYAPSATFTKREVFQNARPRKNIISELSKDVIKFAGLEVLLSFTCDTYQDIDIDMKLTREAIQILQGCNILVNILTKSGQNSERDFDLLSSKKSKYGVTLTFLNDNNSVKYEPYTSLPQERIRTLKKAKQAGIQTWVSLEPVIDPQQSLEIIHKTHDFVDMFKIGKWNHDKKANEINWKNFGNKAIALMEKYNKEYYIKKDLAKYL